MTAARIFSRISPQSTCRASRPSKKVRKSASMSCRGPRGSRPPTSRKAADKTATRTNEKGRPRAAFLFLPRRLHAFDHRLSEARALHFLRGFHLPVHVVGDDL